jgi:cyanophycinase
MSCGPVRSLSVACILLCYLSANAAEEGTVVLHGGGTVSSETRDLFLELSGGRSARLLVIPTADPDTPEDDGRVQIWRTRQPASVALLHAKSREQAESEAFAQPLKQATGVWISGGRQGTLASMYLGTPVERELSALLKRGGVIGGTSAGAAIQTRVMIVAGRARDGFDLVPNCVVDQHFLSRNRQERLWNVLALHPQRLGIGIDEDTAAVIRGDRLMVLGESTVTICVAADGSQSRRLEQLKSGDEFDLKSRRMKLAASE